MGTPHGAHGGHFGAQMGLSRGPFLGKHGGRGRGWWGAPRSPWLFWLPALPRVHRPSTGTSRAAAAAVAAPVGRAGLRAR